MNNTKEKSSWVSHITKYVGKNKNEIVMDKIKDTRKIIKEKANKSIWKQNMAANRKYNLQMNFRSLTCPA